ncbi:protein-glutamine gamma-glutamyltransferase K [Pelobates fuscus]|uniref:protein-glutamine gamma-glutamyltransferase K n=1 Tax=Pelobates fuscus TaxID=191477 RepID=UPI002FE4BC5F
MSRSAERKKSWWERCCSCCASNRGEDTEDYVSSSGGGFIDRPGRPTDRPRDPDGSGRGTESETGTDTVTGPRTGEGRDRSDRSTDINLDDLPSGEISKTALQIQSVDLLKSRNGENRQSHHTDQYEYEDLIVRRGKPFKICINFKRSFNIKSDQIAVILQMANGQPITLPLIKEFDEGGWGCQVSDVSGQKVMLWVNTSAQAPVGKYQLSVRTQCPGGSYAHPTDSSLKVYLLFNPWCRMDAVFMDNEAWLQEYVLNENGRIYYGTEYQIGERSWSYGQFDKGVLDAVMYILDRGGLSPTSRGDPISVTRVVSALVNSMDDNGVVAGSWADDYPDGVNPVAWVGSVDILLRFHQTGSSVKYGQCWVFAGVTTTVLRCLGIPGRTITNFASAHDTDKNLTFDVYFDENMKPLEDKNSDSVWNYHCWNDCWMTRPDLPPGYSGWQAIDATPQETSSGTYCCGPSPLLAIKNGLVNIKHDTPFIFSEVNSDKVFYQRMANGQFKKVHVEERAVGHCISTKAVGSNAREDITYLYKYPEGSAEERNSVRTAAQYGNKPMAVAEPLTSDDIVMTVESQDGVLTGSDINVRVLLNNRSSSRRSLSLTMSVAVMYYNGVCKESFKNDTRNVSINPGETKSVGMLVSYNEYRTHLLDQAAMMLTVSGIVQETSQKLAKQHTFRIRTPDLAITVHGEAVVGQQITAEIKFQNPLEIVLHNAVFHVEGPGLQRPKTVPVGDIGPRKTVSIQENFTPQRPGPRQFIASLESNELNQVHGSTEVVVRSS